MIEYIKGELTDSTPAMVVIEAAGVGYGLNVSLHTGYRSLSKLRDKGKKNIRARGYFFM